jgi:hypothetical protein
VEPPPRRLPPAADGHQHILLYKRKKLLSHPTLAAYFRSLCRRHFSAAALLRLRRRSCSPMAAHVFVIIPVA